MPQTHLTDEAISAMTSEERRDLIRRLERPIEEILGSPQRLKRIRSLRLGIIVTITAGLVPWIAYLALTLPGRYVAEHWTATWVGFDILLVLFMTATAILGFLRRQLLVLPTFTTGVLLVCDAWFDVMTAGPQQVWLSVCSALIVELPLALLLIATALSIVRMTINRLWLIDPGAPLWRVPLLL